MEYTAAHFPEYRQPWIGGFSSAPNTKQPKEFVPDPEAAKKLKLLFLSCVNKDGLIRISQDVHSCLNGKGSPPRVARRQPRA